MSEDSHNSGGSIITSRAGRSDNSTEISGTTLYLDMENKYKNIRMPLAKFKDFIKGHINDSAYDTILLRILEDTGTTFIKYRKKETK